MRSAALMLLFCAFEVQSATTERPSQSFGIALACPSANGAVSTKRLSEFGCVVAESAMDGLAGAKPINPSASREWREAETDSNASIYIDLAGAEKLSYLIAAWIKVQYKNGQLAPHKGSVYTTRIFSVTYSCRDKMLSAGMSLLYDSQGNPIDLLPPAFPGQAPFPADSSIPEHLEDLCQLTSRNT